MAKYYPNNRYSTIRFQAHKNKLALIDIQRALGVSKKTLQDYIQRPMLMKGEQMLILCGLFGLTLPELAYLLERDKSQLKSEDKWHIESIRLKHKDL